MNYTTAEQSKKLVALGLDTKTADMCWKLVYDELHIMSDYVADLLPYKLYSGWGIPCWSVGRLMELMCEDKDYDISTSFGGWKDENFIEEWFCTYQTESGDYHFTHDKALACACYKMIVWLLKNKKL